jgi:hypothetical protein
MMSAEESKTGKKAEETKHVMLDNVPKFRIPQGSSQPVDFKRDDIVCDDRLSGLLKYYEWKGVSWYYLRSQCKRQRMLAPTNLKLFAALGAVSSDCHRIPCITDTLCVVVSAEQHNDAIECHDLLPSLDSSSITEGPKRLVVPQGHCSKV